MELRDAAIFSRFPIYWPSLDSPNSTVAQLPNYLPIESASRRVGLRHPTDSDNRIFAGSTVRRTGYPRRSSAHCGPMYWNLGAVFLSTSTSSMNMTLGCARSP